MLSILISSVIVIALIIASITDLKTREVPDWINFSLVPLGIGIRLIWSIIINDYSFILAGLIGFLIMFLLALIMFYTGQWGGGDSKMLMGLGALIGIDYNSLLSLNILLTSDLLSFLINIIVIGSFYGLIWSVFISIRNRKKFLKELKKITKNIVRTRKIMIILFIVFLLGVVMVQNILIKLTIVAFIILFHGTFYLFIFVKAVEKSSMLKYVKPTDVTEGDWIVKDIIIDKKYISGPKDLGIEKKQLNKLIAYYKIGKIKKVLIKIGIPFIPSFLLAYLGTLLFGNIILMFI